MGKGVARVSGHFGEWLQGRLGPGGPIALLTLACADLAVHATRLGDGALSLRQVPEVISERRARDLLTRLGVPLGAFRIEADMPPGGGAGASTASLLALARAAGAACDTATLGRICLAVEGATDPLMLPCPDTALWAPRKARVLDDLPAPRRAEIVGGFWGPPVRTDPDDVGFPDISDLVADWRSAATLADQARLASRSADRSTTLRGPNADPTRTLADRLGALGYVRAHTGSARGLVFAPGTVPVGAEDDLRRAGYAQVLTFSTGRSR